MQQSLSVEERLESLKAGLISGATAAVMEGVFQAIQIYLWPKAAVVVGLFNATFWMGLAIAGLSGFLFGVTCRYAIRQDNNPHLSSGVVLAFGLVRGLAQVPLEEVAIQDATLVFFALAESLALFAMAYVALSAAIRLGWVKSLC
jgi:hypothetical protein